MSSGSIGAHRTAPQQAAGFDPLALYAKHASNGPMTPTESRKFYEALKNEYKVHSGEKMPLFLKATIRPGANDVIGTASLARFKDSLEGAKEHKRQNLNPTFNARVDGHALVGTSKVLGGGAFNKVYQCQFRDRAMPSGTFREMAVKTAKSQFHNGDVTFETTIQRGVGISPATPRIPDRNVATAAVNHMLGTDSVPEAEAGFLDGRPVVAMSIAPGETLKSFYATNPDIVRDPQFQRQMSDVEVNAFLSANPDTHSENLMIRAERQPDGSFADVKLTMIDNDMCFGHRMTNPDQPPEFFTIQKMTYKSTGLPAYMDARTADAVKGLNVEDCARTLQPNLDAAEMDAFKSRASLLKDHVAFLESNNRIVSDWATFTNADGAAVDGENFFAGTLRMAGVQSGLTPDGEPVFQPRSLIMRDMAQYQNDFSSVVPAEHRDFEIAVTWSQASGKLVPPSGIDHGDAPPASDEEDNYQRTPASVPSPATNPGDTPNTLDSIYANAMSVGVSMNPVQAPLGSNYANALFDGAPRAAPNVPPGSNYANAMSEGVSMNPARDVPSQYANAVTNDAAPPVYANAPVGSGVAAPATGWVAARPNAPRQDGAVVSGGQPAPAQPADLSFDLRDTQNGIVRV